MPYIHKERRKALWNDSKTDHDDKMQTAGELNFMITQLVCDYLKHHNENYQSYNDILGALEGAKLELYRRKIGSYENKKKNLNGDVYK